MQMFWKRDQKIKNPKNKKNVKIKNEIEKPKTHQQSKKRRRGFQGVLMNFQNVNNFHKKNEKNRKKKGKCEEIKRNEKIFCIFFFEKKNTTWINEKKKKNSFKKWKNQNKRFKKWWNIYRFQTSFLVPCCSVSVLSSCNCCTSCVSSLRLLPLSACVLFLRVDAHSCCFGSRLSCKRTSYCDHCVTCLTVWRQYVLLFWCQQKTNQKS